MTNRTPGAVTGAGTADREVDPIPVPPLGKQLQPWHWVAIDWVVAVLLAARGAAVTAEPGGGLAVTGLAAPAIADLAREHAISVHELTPRHASLEEAYMELTHDSVEYRADVPDYAGREA